MQLPTRITLLALCSGLAASHAQTPSAAPAAANPSDGSDVVQMDLFEVTDVYSADATNPLARPTDGILGAGRSLLDTPRAATTLTPALIAEQGIDRLPDLVAFTPGAYAPASYGLLTTPVIRGDTAESYANGQRLSYNNYGYLPSFNSVEAIDLVRGPASAVFGAGHQLGGYVNYQTKQPSFEGAKTVVTLRAGSWVPGSNDSFAHGSVQLDTTAPVNERLAWRLSYEGQGGETFYHRNGAKDNREDIFAALAWKPTAEVKVDANLHFFWQNTPETLGVNRVTQALIDHGIYESDSGPVKLPDDRVLFSHGDNSDAKIARAQVIVSDRVSPALELVNRALYERVDRGRYNQFEYTEYVVQNTFENRTEAHWNFDALGHEQQAVIGGALRYEGVDSRVGYSNLAGGDYGYFDITDPARIFSAAAAVSYPYFDQFVGPDGHLVEDAVNGNTVRSDVWNPALFWQQDMALTKTLRATVGLREDFYRARAHDLYPDSQIAVDNEGRTEAFDPSDAASVNAFSQAYSLTWQARSNLSFYATHNRIRSSKGSVTGGGVDLSGGTIDPEDFRNQSVLWEAGAKASLLDHKLFAGAALFQQDREERNLFGDKDDIRVRGLELETFYQPAAGTTVFANATFQSGYYKQADIYQAADLINYTTGVGDWALVGFSNTLLNAGVRHRFECGFGYGLNGRWQSPQNVNIATPGYPLLKLPAQFSIDASVFYEAPRWTATVEVLNLTDEHNWVHNGDAFTGSALLSRELPLRVDGRLTWKF